MHSKWISSKIKQALDQRAPVVALESTVIAHGLPWPDNHQTAVACQKSVRDAAAVPATIGVVNGLPKIGLTDDELQQFATGEAPNGSRIEKVTLNNLGAVIAGRAWGATTVAASIRIATLGGQSFRDFRRRRRPLVFATGGIGGVHRGASDTFDISADLTALARSQIICVSSGAKAILDLPKTVEYLESSGVPVLGYKTVDFPAFYSAKSGLAVTAAIEGPAKAAQIAVAHWRSGGAGAVLVCVPVPPEYELPADEMERAIGQALEKANAQGVRGKALTPFLLAEVATISSGRSLEANKALLINNASVAGMIAVALNELV